MDYNDNHHIIRTTAQWQDRSIANVVIERGTLCIELVPGGKTKIKIGEGNKYYRQLPYVGDGSDLSNYYTKEEIDQLLDTLNRMAVASTIEYETYGRLPLKNNKLGDVRFVKNTSTTSTDPLVYLWNGSKWIPFSSIIDIDLSEYAKKSEVNPRLDSLEEKAHTHDNKPILDDTTASYTTEEKEKLADLHNYDDTEIKGRVTDLEEIAHTHDNKDVLDDITAPYTTEEKEKLAELENYVLPVATTDTLGGIKVGDNLDIDDDGHLIGMRYVTDNSGIEIIYKRYTYDENYHFTSQFISYCRSYYWKKYNNGECIAAFLQQNAGGGISVSYTSGSPFIMSQVAENCWMYFSSDGGSTYGEPITNIGSVVDERGRTWYYAVGTPQVLGSVRPTDESGTLINIYYGRQGGEYDAFARLLLSLSIVGIYQYEGTVVNTGVIDLTKNASGNLVVSKYSGQTEIQLDGSSDFIGTDGTNTGTHGLVPAPTAADVDKFLSSDGTWQTVSSGGSEYQAGNGVTIDTETDPNTISLNLGAGLSFDENGAVQANGGIEYVGGDGISITQGSGTTDISSLVWVQGSIDEHGIDDDTVTSTIRSPFIESGLTDMINLSANDTSDVELKWKIFYYDSNHDFISCDTTWSIRTDYVQKPLGCAYIRIVLTRNEIDPILPSDLGYCELSYPIEIGKYVISNTGVTHIELDGHQSVQTIENGNTNNLFTFSDEFTIDQQNNVSITDFHRLILNVSE